MASPDGCSLGGSRWHGDSACLLGFARPDQLQSGQGSKSLGRDQDCGGKGKCTRGNGFHRRNYLAEDNDKDANSDDDDDGNNADDVQLLNSDANNDTDGEDELLFSGVRTAIRICRKWVDNA